MMISYAQNFEDVILARAFREQASGFYIDIGVWEPTKDSVTKHFYDRGWSGVNVEPVPRQFEVIAADRIRDININAAVSTVAGPLTLSHVKGTGLSTSRKDYAERHSSSGLEIEEIRVQTISLRDLCAQHAGHRPIDFLKIDVEGAEADVVRSGDWNLYRPRIVVIEATEPRLPIASHAEWEPLMLGAGYLQCYFDGLNRWYVPQEEQSLCRFFKAPPNSFDDFKLARVNTLESKIKHLQDEIRVASKISENWNRANATALGRLMVNLAWRVGRRADVADIKSE